MKLEQSSANLFKNDQNMINSINMIPNQPLNYNTIQYKQQTSQGINVTMPFDSLAQPFNNDSFNNKIQISEKTHKMESNITCSQTPDSDTDEDDCIHVTFNLNEHAASLVNNLSTESIKQLEQLGILSLQLKNEKPIKIKSSKQSSISASNLNIQTNQNVTVNYDNYLGLTEMKQEKLNFKPNDSLTTNSTTLPSTSQFLIQQSPNKVLINNTTLTSNTPIQAIQPPAAKKRNRKTINELTNHLTSNYYSTNETIRQEETAAENSIKQSQQIQPKRKRSTKSDLDTSQTETPKLNQYEEANIEQKVSHDNQMYSNGNGSDIIQVYLIEKNQASDVNQSFQQSNQLIQHQQTQQQHQTFSGLNTDIVTLSTNNIINFTDHNNNFNNNEQQNVIQQQQQQQQKHFMVQQQQFQLINQQQQQLQYQPIFNNNNNQPKINQQQYRMPSPMLANILSTNEQPTTNNYTQMKQQPNEIYLINSNHQMINDNNQLKDNDNNNYSLNDNKPYPSLNELQLLKSEDYKQIYQMRQMLAMQQNQINPQQHEHMQIQIHNPAASKKRRTPADPSKTRAKRTKLASNTSSDTKTEENSFNIDLSISNDNKTSIKETINYESSLRFEQNNASNYINQQDIHLTNNMDKYIDFNLNSQNQRESEPKEKNQLIQQDLCNSIGSSNSNNSGSSSVNSNNSSPNLKEKSNLDDNQISKINLQLIDPQSIYSNSNRVIPTNLDANNQASNLIYLNPNGVTNDNVNKIKSLNFVSFKLNNPAPVSSSYSSSSSSPFIIDQSQIYKTQLNKQNPSNLIYTNNDNSFPSISCASLSSSSTASSSCFNNYEFINTKSNSPIKQLSPTNSLHQLNNNNTLQSINFITTDDESKKN